MNDALSLEIVDLRTDTPFPAWHIVDDNGETIAEFDSRGGWKRADAERFVEENEAMKCRSCGHVPCSQYCGADERS